jgi:hypothetical protein
MPYDDYEEREKLDIVGFILLMVICFFLCLFGYIFGRIIITFLGG